MLEKSDDDIGRDQNFKQSFKNRKIIPRRYANVCVMVNWSYGQVRRGEVGRTEGRRGRRRRR